MVCAETTQPVSVNQSGATTYLEKGRDASAWKGQDMFNMTCSLHSTEEGWIDASLDSQRAK